jgi:two-component system OmpR family response regulator
MKTDMRLLLVEDDPELARGLASRLAAAGFAADLADNGIDGEFMGREAGYDAIVLDLGLPGRPGLEVLANWRAAGIATPVLILTARDSWHERVDGLRAGADDYLGKPFHVEELLARLQALIRRSSGQAGAQISAGDLRLDEERQLALLDDGREIDLTGTEFRLLRYFMLHPGSVLSKTRLTEHVYDQDFDRDSNLIEVYVRRLREKLGAERIETRRGQGYVFRGDAG